MSAFRVTVAICTWNRSALLAQTLEGLRSLVVPRDVEWDVLVVDNNSKDDTSVVVKQFEGRLPVRYVFQRVPGLSHARNMALAEASGTHVIFTDDDVLVAADWLENAVATWRRHPDAAVIGGPIDPWFPVEPDPVLARAFPFLANGFCGLLRDTIERPLTDQEHLNGANFSVQVRQLGGENFDPSLGHAAGRVISGEETEFIKRVRRKGGLVVWSPQMRVRHYVDPSRMTLTYLRRYYSDFGRAQVRQHGLPGRIRIGGAPLWLWRQIVVTFVKAQSTRIFASRERSLLALRDYLISRGMFIESCLGPHSPY